MKVRIMFDWAGNIYEWIIDWYLPYFPSVGDTLEFQDFVEKGIIKDFKDVKFKGRYKYDGLETSIYHMLQNCYQNKIVNINWLSDSVELEITSVIYENESRLWDECKS